MAAQNPPVNGVAFSVYIALQDMTNPGSYKANPTLAAGDAKVSIDGGALANLATLPAVGPAGSIWVLVTLSAAEMTGDNIAIQLIDQTNPKEWADYGFVVQTVAGAWLRPTTAGRTLDVTAGGNAGIDWANVEAPTTAQGLTGTTIATSQVVASVTGAVASVTGAVGSVTGAVGSVTGNVGGNVTGSVGSVAAGGIAAASFAANAIDASAVAASAVTEIQSGLATAAALTTVDTVVDAIQAKTDNLPVDPADQSLIIAATNAIVSDIATVDTVVDAIKAKTDNLPTDPADQSLLIAAIAAVETDTQDLQTRVPAALVGGRIDASVGALAAGVITAAGIAADALAAIADKFLGRSIAGGADGGRSVADALKLLRNRRAVAAGTLTVYEADDATPAWTAAVTTTAGNPTSQIDPA